MAGGVRQHQHRTGFAAMLGDLGHYARLAQAGGHDNKR